MSFPLLLIPFILVNSQIYSYKLSEIHSDEEKKNEQSYRPAAKVKTKCRGKIDK